MSKYWWILEGKYNYCTLFKSLVGNIESLD